MPLNYATCDQLFIALPTRCFLSPNFIRSQAAHEDKKRKYRSIKMAHNRPFQVNQRHLFDGGDLDVYEQRVINLSAGCPGPDLLLNCPEIFRRATEHRMKLELENKAYLFQYGPAIGDVGYRKTIAEFLTKYYKEPANHHDLIQTSGATHGLHMVLSTLVDMAAIIFVDDVTYMIALDSMRQFSSMKIVPVPLKEDGVDMDALSGLVEKYKFKSESKLFWGLYYTIPTYHNPTGRVFTPQTCEKLIQLARKHDFLIGCDDVYNLLWYDEESQKPPKRLFAYDRFDDADFKGNVVSIGTFSKLLSPGLRIGWMECPPRIVKTFHESGVLRSGGAASNYTGGIVESLIQLGLMDEQLEIYRAKYKERMHAALETLEKYLPKECKYLKPKGGYFIWIEFPKSVDCVAFNEFCLKKYRVVAIAGPRFSVTGQFRNYLRLTIAFHDKEVLRASIKTLCLAYSDYVSK